MAAPTYKTESGRLYHAGQLLVSAVGLPARGKTHVIRSLERYMGWIGISCRVFSLGDYRRSVISDSQTLPPDYFQESSTERSEATEKLRAEIREGLIQQVIDYFKEENGQIAFYDANNATIASRQALRDRFGPLGIQVFFIENVCEDSSIVDANIRAVKLSSPDYAGWDPEKAVADYWGRIRDHEKTYETIENPSFPYVKVINVGQRLIMNNIKGYLQSRMLFFLMNIHNRFRTIFFARSGQSQIEHSYKADSGLSADGRDYACQLRDFITARRISSSNERRLKDGKSDEGGRDLTVWTSARRRCVETTEPFRAAGIRVKTLSQLSEINPGVVDGMTPEEIQQRFPEMYAAGQEDPWSHRYPRAESYHDLSVRLEPVIFELERDKSDLLIIGHASVLRCLFAYLKGLPPTKIPSVDIRRGDVIEVTPTAYGVKSHTHAFWRAEEKSWAKEELLYGSPMPSMMSDLSLSLNRPAPSLLNTVEESGDSTRSLLSSGSLSAKTIVPPKHSR